MNCIFSLLLTAALFAAVKGTCQILSQTECESSNQHLHCGASGWRIACLSNQHCACLHSRSCSSDTDCGQLEITGSDGSTVSYGCPSSGEWGCHHVGYSHDYCGCLYRDYGIGR